MLGLLDTNIVIRILTDDPPDQARRARSLLAECRSSGQQLLLPVTHFLEVGYVLESVYGSPVDETAQSLSALIEDPAVLCEEPTVLLETVSLYRQGADLPDAYLAARARSEQRPVFSFDRGFDRLGVKRLVRLS